MSEFNVPDNPIEALEQTEALFDVIKSTHGLLKLGTKRDRYLEMGDTDRNRRFVFWSGPNNDLPLNHFRITLTPDTSKPVIADVHRLTLLIPQVPYVVDPALNRLDKEVAHTVATTNDVVVIATRTNGEQAKLYVSPAGAQVVEGAKDFDAVPEDEFIFSGQALRVQKTCEGSYSQSDFDANWFDIAELNSMLEFYDLFYQDNAGPSASNVA